MVDPSTAAAAAAPSALPRANAATDSSGRPVAALPALPCADPAVGGMVAACADFGGRRGSTVGDNGRCGSASGGDGRGGSTSDGSDGDWLGLGLGFCALDFFFAAIFLFSLAHGLSACISHAVHHPHGKIVIFINPIGQAIGTTATTRKSIFSNVGIFFSQADITFKAK